MQAHKNSTPLGIHARRRAAVCRVVSMRCGTTAFKKGKQKQHPPGHIATASPSSEAARSNTAFRTCRVCGSGENYTAENAPFRSRASKSRESRSKPSILSSFLAGVFKRQRPLGNSMIPNNKSYNARKRKQCAKYRAVAFAFLEDAGIMSTLAMFVNLTRYRDDFCIRANANVFLALLSAPFLLLFLFFCCFFFCKA